MFEEKIVIKLAEIKTGYWIRKNVLLTIENGETIRVYKMKRKLQPREKKLLDHDIKIGLRAMRNKLIGGAPLRIADGSIFYDDMLLLKVDGKIIIANVIE